VALGPPSVRASASANAGRGPGSPGETLGRDAGWRDFVSGFYPRYDLKSSHLTLCPAR
jgi:hypothetical protein